MSGKIELIAEIGSNFDGDLDNDRRHVAAARKAGADAVKFQTLARDTLIAPLVFDSAAGEWVQNPRFEGFANIALPDEWHYRLKETADNEGIEFMSTPFSLEAVGLLEDVGVRRYKLASGDLTFRPLQEKVARTGKPVLLSTGASYLEEVQDALAHLQTAGCGPVTVMHCTASYPPAFSELSLRALTTLAQATGRPVGLSDHSPGWTAPVAAAALGATVIEKHVTFDRSLPGPDHAFALTYEELARTAEALREVSEALGSDEKKPAGSEIGRRSRLRRGIYDPRTFRPAASGIWLRPEHEGS